MNQVSVPSNKLVDMPYSPSEYREGVIGLENHIREEMVEFHIEPEIRHFFANGLYGREMTLIAGGVVVGKIHKQSHIVSVSRGSGYVLTEHGAMRYEAGLTFVSEPCTKRTIKAETETVWLTLHATQETDLDKIEAEVIAPDYESLGGDA